MIGMGLDCRNDPEVQDAPKSYTATDFALHRGKIPCPSWQSVVHLHPLG